ncbi:MAG TPA: hypothetical protein VK547_15245 [Candidatus Udaeobacter sp.]|nr:hypothetical protein [Candidatus Udaeobacter sp.]
MPRQLEPRPRAPEEPGPEPTRIGHFDDQQASGGEPLEHASHGGDGIRHVLEDVESRHAVELARRERRLEQVAGVYARAEAPGLLRRGLVHLDAGDLPAEGLSDAQRAA